MWVCNFCFNRNHFPPQYSSISETCQPAEVQFTTLDYTIMRAPVQLAPVFLYVIDTCVDEEELNALKSSILDSLTLLPSNALVGLITFHRIISLWALNDPNLKSFVFQGTKDYTAKQIQEWLNLSPLNQQQAMQNPNAPHVASQPQMPHMMNAGNQQQLMKIKNKSTMFISPISQCQNVFQQIVSQVQRDPWPVSQGMCVPESHCYPEQHSRSLIDFLFGKQVNVQFDQPVPLCRLRSVCWRRPARTPEPK